jgi:hypothetical protein
MMNMVFINAELIAGGVMTVSRNVHGVKATMHYKGNDPERVCGEYSKTPEKAVASLEKILADTERSEG